MAKRVRQRVAAVLTCVVIAGAAAGSMMRNAEEVARDLPPTTHCENDRGKSVACLILFRD